ncbi:lipopolysaccharide kinase [Rasiella rasia]|uniref:Lipopolysaccharide kinase n=1 Tax=Rasiella rasia TaxID=2744027 RepID=A0A6G6GJT3_9FLAO|nr:lipopolysaccharide kinase InaA family protein [Rasiella rasia]QIE58835.1 lipopolysaccharide kinase [Rasiella rasia]
MTTHFVMHPKFTVFEKALHEVLLDFETSGDYVTKGDRNVIKKVTLDGQTFNIKRFKTPNLAQSLVYRFLRKSKAKRSFEYASLLIEKGIKTPFPVAYLENFSGGLKDSYYVSEHVAYDFDFRVLNHNPRWPNRAEILKQMAAFTFQLHENSINFLDHSPGNTLIKHRGEGAYDFYLIDLNRMRFETLNLDQRMHNFRRLWLSKTMINIMAKEYASLFGTSEKETHALMTKHSREFQKKVNSKKLRKRRRK